MLAFEPLEQQWKTFHGAAIVAKIEAVCSVSKEEATASSVAVQEMCKSWQWEIFGKKYVSAPVA